MRNEYLAWVLSRMALLLVVVMGIGVLLTTPILSLKQYSGSVGAVGYSIAVLLAVIALALAQRLSGSIFRAIAVLDRRLRYGGEQRWIAMIIVAGVALRLAWVLAFPSVATSDGAVYLRLATQLVNGEPFLSNGNRAYWPPGYPLFLVPWVALPITPKAAVVVSNLVLYALTIPVVMRLGRRAGGEGAGRLATFLLAVWPSYFANAGTPEKENVLIFLLPFALLLYLQERPDGTRPIYFPLAAGIALGLATLVQPSVLLFWTVFLCYELLSARWFASIVLRLGLLLVGMAIAIAPWTIRNYLVLHEPVLISTNGGDNFYRANNPLATGDFTPRGEVILQGDEVSRSKQGFQLGRQWIVSHPGDFFALVLAKQTLFLGDDSTGIYNSLRIGGGAGPKAYFAVKALANTLWYLLWVTILVALWRERTRFPSSPLEATIALGYSYFFVLHSLFESSSKYHFPVVAFLAVLFSIVTLRQGDGLRGSQLHSDRDTVRT